MKKQIAHLTSLISKHTSSIESSRQLIKDLKGEIEMVEYWEQSINKHLEEISSLCGDIQRLINNK